jgi:PKD repeat protein
VLSNAGPGAEFTSDQTIGYPPLTVRFTDLSTGSPAEWQWDFENDGIIDDTVRSPTHTYIQPGMYSVSLYVRNSGGSDPQVKLDYITVEEPDPVLRIGNLDRKIQELPFTGWPQWFLERPLERASDQLENGRTPQAIHQMNTFIQVVELLHGFQMLNGEEAMYLTNEAMTIIGLLQE